MPSTNAPARLVQAVVLAASLASLSACRAPTPGAAPAVPADPGAAPLAAPEDDASAAPTLGTAPGAVSTLSAGLAATVAASLPAVPTPAAADAGGTSLGPSFDGASAAPLPSAPDEPERYVTHTTGMRGFDPQVDHQVAVWEQDGEGGWRQLAGVTLSDIDYLPEDDPAIASPAPGLTWLGYSGGVGAHGGCFALVVWDGTALSEALSHCAGSPGAGELVDLDGDGGPEVVLDQTDDYVFCYACGMKHFSFAAKAWDGAALVDVSMEAPVVASAVLQEAARLGAAGLWRQARLAFQTDDSPDGPTLAGALISRHASAFADQAASSPYPLLAHAFYGNYEAALEPFRDVPMADALRADGPLVAGTVAEGWEESLAEWLERTTSAAVAAEPDLAAAWFLRGWAAQLANPASTAAREHVGRAATLDPGEPLYAAAVEALVGG